MKPFDQSAQTFKPFDLEAAKRGEPIQLRSGAKCKFIAHVPDAMPDCRVIFLLPDGMVGSRPEDGHGYVDSMDLVMAPKKRTVWVNLYLQSLDDCYQARWYYTQMEADFGWGGVERIGNRAWPLEIEE